MAATLTQDAVGHRSEITGTALAAGAVSTTAVGTIAGTTSAGAAPTVTFVTGVACTDAGGTFQINPVTGGGAQAAGEVAVITFNNPYARIPSAIQVNMFNSTDTTGAIVASASTVTAAGFKLMVGTALTTAKVYNVSFTVTP